MTLSPGCKLNQRHIQILDFYLQGVSGSEIARRLEMVQPQVSIIINSPSFQHELALRRAVIAEKKDALVAERQACAADDPVVEELKKSALLAAQRLSLNVCDTNGSVAHKACVDILDRAGYGAVKKLNIQERSVSIVISAADASLIADTVRMIKSDPSSFQSVSEGEDNPAVEAFQPLPVEEVKA